MKAEEYLSLIARLFTANTVHDIIPYCAEDVVYISGAGDAILGREAVKEFLLGRQEAIAERKAFNYGFAARVTKSDVPSVPVGTPCVAVSQYDRYNCTGFMVPEVNGEGKIQRLHFHRDRGVSFEAPVEGEGFVTHVPKDARDGIFIRALGFGIMDKRMVPSKHIQRYDVFNDNMNDLYRYIYYHLNEHFNEGIENAAGYTYAAAMIEAVNRQRPGDIPFRYVCEDAVKGVVPDAPEHYRDWLDEGYAMGVKLFLGFTEYAGLQGPLGNDEFEHQMMQSYMDMCLYGSVQANKDMDLGLI